MRRSSVAERAWYIFPEEYVEALSLIEERSAAEAAVAAKFRRIEEHPEEDLELTREMVTLLSLVSLSGWRLAVRVLGSAETVRDAQRVMALTNDRIRERFPELLADE